MVCIKSLKQIIKYCYETKQKYFIIGNGSNLLISDEYFDEASCTQILMAKFHMDYPDDKPLCVKSLGAIIRYLEETQKTDLSHINKIKI